MKANQAHHHLTTMARVLEVSPSGYHSWNTRLPSERDCDDALLTEQIKTIHAESRGTYGAPRIHAELREQQVFVGKKRVARLMRDAGLVGVHRRKWPVTTVQEHAAQPADDLVQRDFTASAPNEVWVSDITYVPTTVGFLYLAVVLDVFSRKVVGWSMAGHLRTELVLSALEMAVAQRDASGVIHHSDRGCQYTSYAFGQRCERAGIRPSMGRVGDCYDNAMAESFFATLECELIERKPAQPVCQCLDTQIFTASEMK